MYMCCVFINTDLLPAVFTGDQLKGFYTENSLQQDKWIIQSYHDFNFFQKDTLVLISSNAISQYLVASMPQVVSQKICCYCFFGGDLCEQTF